MPGGTGAGSAFFAGKEAAGEIIGRARDCGGPALLECNMVRFYGHFEGDAQTYRAKGELEAIRASRDCLTILSERLIEAGVIAREELQAVDREVNALIEDAVRAAKAAPLPAAEDLLSDVYVTY